MSERPPGTSVRVLLVDDDPTFRDLGVGTLARRTDLSVIAASTPREALETLREHPVDAVVSDVDMPGAAADGADLYRAVRDRWGSMPFVLFTGTSPERLSARVDHRSDPAAAYVRKGPLPGHYDLLAERVERVVGRGRDPDRVDVIPMTSTARAIELFCR